MIRSQKRSSRPTARAARLAGSDSIRVLTVDDSALIRLTLNRYLNQNQDIDVIGQAANGREMLDMVGTLEPDVIVLDVEMPEMDGIEALGHLMRTRPTPVIMLSNLTWTGAEVTLRALEMGAVDFVLKPRPGITMAATVDSVVDKIRAVVRCRVQPRAGHTIVGETASNIAGAQLHPAPERPKETAALAATDWVVCVASSTGGPSALTDFLAAVPPGLPIGGVIVQHMPAGFTAILARRLNQIGRLRVVEAASGSQLRRSQFLVAPGGYHLVFDEEGQAQLTDGPTVNGVRPAADVTMKSLARLYGPRLIGVVLTGMGKDSLAGARTIHAAGGLLVAQNEESSVVYGMPRLIVEKELARMEGSPEALGASLGDLIGL